MFILHCFIAVFYRRDSKEILVVSNGSSKKETIMEQVTEYFEDWLIPELASAILQLILKDESGNVPPQIKADAFLVLHSKFSKTLKFGTTLGESFHASIVSHLKVMCASTPNCRLEVFILFMHYIFLFPV